jgi:hypothetical protein
MKRVYTDKFLRELQPEAASASFVEAVASHEEANVVRFRDQIEKWFQSVDKSAQNVILPGLRSSDDSKFYPAFFSLALHRFVEQSGWQLRFRPGEPNKSTFQVTVDNPACEFDMEVAAVMPRETPHGREESLFVLLSAINEIEGLFTIAVHIRRWPPRGFDPTEVRDSLARWLGTLVNDETYASKRAQYVDGPVDIEFAILSKLDEPRAELVSLWLAPLGVEEHAAGVAEGIEQALAKARAEAPSQRRPFVIALCHADTWGVAENTVMHELYGKPRGVRARSGHSGGRRKVYDYSSLFRQAIFNKEGHEAVSAVLFLEKCWKDEEVCYDLKVYHNPWTTVPLAFEVFALLPQLVPLQTGGEEAGPMLSWRNHLGQLVSLADR